MDNNQCPRNLEMREERYGGEEVMEAEGVGKLVQEELGRLEDMENFTPLLAMPSPGYRYESTGSITASAAVCCGGPSGSCPGRVQLDARWGPMTFCIWLQHRWEAPEGAPVPAVCLGHLSISSLRWRVEAYGELCTFTRASHPATMKQKRSLGGCSLVPNVHSKWHYALQHFGRQILKEWRSILRQNLCVSSPVKKLGHAEFSRRRGIHSVSLFICLAWKLPVDRIAW